MDKQLPCCPDYWRVPRRRTSKYNLYPDVNFSLSPLIPTFHVFSIPMVGFFFPSSQQPLPQRFPFLAICCQKYPLYVAPTLLFNWLIEHCIYSPVQDRYNLPYVCFHWVTLPSGRWKLMPQGRHSHKPIYIDTDSRHTVEVWAQSWLQLTVPPDSDWFHPQYTEVPLSHRQRPRHYLGCMTNPVVYPLAVLIFIWSESTKSRIIVSGASFPTPTPVHFPRAFFERNPKALCLSVSNF